MLAADESGKTATGLEVDGTIVTKGSGGSNWSVSANGVITIKRAYLATLDTGTHTITVLYDNDTSTDVILTITES